MKVSQTIEVDISAKAVLREDKMEVSVTASVPYLNGSRKAQVSVEGLYDQDLYDGLERIMRAAVDDGLASRAIASAAEAERVAENLGEIPAPEEDQPPADTGGESSEE